MAFAITANGLRSCKNLHPGRPHRPNPQHPIPSPGTQYKYGCDWRGGSTWPLVSQRAVVRCKLPHLIIWVVASQFASMTACRRSRACETRRSAKVGDASATSRDLSRLATCVASPAPRLPHRRLLSLAAARQQDSCPIRSRCGGACSS